MFPVKYRKAFLDKVLIKIIRETAIGMDRDHIHLLCGAHPKISIGRIVQVFKSITVREIFMSNPTVKRELLGEEF